MTDDALVVAALQMNSGDDPAANLAQAEALLAEAARGGAQLAVLPENFAFMGGHERDKLALAETPGEGPLQSWLAGAAARHRLWVVGGTLPLRAPASQGERVRAACLLIDPQGQCRARYDKIHLFDVQLAEGESYRESASIAPGPPQPLVAALPFAGLGLAVCYDLRFAELFAALEQGGATGFCLPSAFTARTTQAHWAVLLRARAIENQCWMVAPNQCGGHPGGRRTGGQSMIIDAWGTVLAEAGDQPQALLASIDLSAQRALRERLPVRLHHRLPR